MALPNNTKPVPIENGDGRDSGDYPPVASSSNQASTTTASAPTPPAASGSTSSTAAPAQTTSAAVVTPTQRVSSLLQSVTVPVATSVIPLAALPSQTLAIALGNQNCTIKVYTRATGLFLDLYVSDQPIAIGVICLDRNIIVRAAYLGFEGELVFIDSQGTSDPTYDGLGTRYNLLWLNY